MADSDLISQLTDLNQNMLQALQKCLQQAEDPELIEWLGEEIADTAEDLEELALLAAGQDDTEDGQGGITDTGMGYAVMSPLAAYRLKKLMYQTTKRGSRT